MVFRAFDSEWNEIIDLENTTLKLPTILPSFLPAWPVWDPRMALVTGRDGEPEPLVTFDFNMSPMRFYFPFHPERGVINAEIDGKFHWGKNWGVIGSDRERIFVARTVSPWVLLECTYGGKCKSLGVPPKDCGELRGGTQWVPMPGRGDILVAWPRTNIKCECGGRFYRPHLAVARGTGRDAALIALGTSFDFGVEVVPWFPHSAAPQCWKIQQNVMTPMSIPRWRVLDGTDEMEVTLSLSDRVVVLVRVRGLLAQLNALLDAGALAGPEYDRLYRESQDFCSDYAREQRLLWTESQRVEFEAWKKAGEK